MTILPHDTHKLQEVFGDNCTALIVYALLQEIDFMKVGDRVPSIALGKISLDSLENRLGGAYTRKPLLKRLKYLEHSEIISTDKNLKKRKLGTYYTIYLDYLHAVVSGTTCIPAYQDWYKRAKSFHR